MSSEPDPAVLPNDLISLTKDFQAKMAVADETLAIAREKTAAAQEAQKIHGEAREALNAARRALMDAVAEASAQ